MARLGGGPRAQAVGSCRGHEAALLPAQVSAQVRRASRPPEVVLPVRDPSEESAGWGEGGGGDSFMVFHGLSWPFVLPAQSVRDGDTPASLGGDSGTRAGGERGLSIAVDLAALTSLRFLSNDWIGKRLAECT